jgi:hypothetical protein
MRVAVEVAACGAVGLATTAVNVALGRITALALGGAEAQAESSETASRPTVRERKRGFMGLLER